jgi:hypothetical protein
MSKQIVQIAQAKAIQTKSQKEFNRLIKKIEKLEKEVVDFREGLVLIQQRVAKDFVPVRATYNEHQAEFVKSLDRAYSSSFFKNAEKKKMVHIIKEVAFALAADMEDIKEIYDKYDEDGFDKINEEADQHTAEMMKKMASMMFGVEIDEDADVSDPEKLTAYITQKMAEQESQREAYQQSRPQRPKTQKQIEKEEKKAIEERSITKAVRTIYMDLVKAFHPDREIDETEKERKTEIMKRVTEAYEKSDLLALLRLQLEFQRIDQDHLERLADDQLKYYNKILKEQVGELEDELGQLEAQAETITSKPSFYRTTPETLNYALDQDIREMKKATKELKKNVIDFREPENIRLFLKGYKIPKRRDDDFFDIFG